MVAWLDSTTAKGRVEPTTAGEKVILRGRGSEEVQQIFHRLRWMSTVDHGKPWWACGAFASSLRMPTYTTARCSFMPLKLVTSTSEAADDSDVNEQSNDEDLLAKRYQV
jgi:hypothetical protein